MIPIPDLFSLVRWGRLQHVSRLRTNVRPPVWSFVLGLAVLFAVPGWTAVAPVAAQVPTGAETCPPPLSSVPTPAPPVILPTHPPAPEQILVCVASQSITGATYEHWANVAMMGEGPHPKHPLKPGEVLREVMGFLVSSYWVMDEAQALGVDISSGQVRRTFDKIRHQQFPREREFRAFLKRSGQTVADLMFRVKLNLLSQRIEKRVVSGHRGAKSQQRALARFVKDFKRKWQAQTYCAAQYATVDCGHAQAPPL